MKRSIFVRMGSVGGGILLLLTAFSSIVYAQTTLLPKDVVPEVSKLKMLKSTVERIDVIQQTGKNNNLSWWPGFFIDLIFYILLILFFFFFPTPPPPG